MVYVEYVPYTKLYQSMRSNIDFLCANNRRDSLNAQLSLQKVRKCIISLLCRFSYKLLKKGSSKMFKNKKSPVNQINHDTKNE